MDSWGVAEPEDKRSGDVSTQGLASLFAQLAIKLGHPARKENRSVVDWPERLDECLVQLRQPPVK